MKLQDLEVGDKVWITHRGGWRVRKVKRFTKTMLIVENSNYCGKKYEERFNLESGDLIGAGKWDFTTAVPFTEEHQKIIDKYKLEESLDTVLTSLLRLKDKLNKQDLEMLMSIQEKYNAEG